MYCFSDACLLISTDSLALQLHYFSFAKNNSIFIRLENGGVTTCFFSTLEGIQVVTQGDCIGKEGCKNKWVAALFHVNMETLKLLKCLYQKDIGSFPVLIEVFSMVLQVGCLC